MAVAARRRARPVGVPLLYDSAGLGSTAERVRVFVRLTFVRGRFRELGKSSSSTLHYLR